MRAEKGNPGARAGASGAKKKRKFSLDEVIQDARAAVHLSKTEKAAFCFAFFNHLKRDPDLKPIDALSAMWMVGYAGDDLKFFMSAKHLSELIRRVPSVAEASLGRLRRGGYLIHVVGDDADHDELRTAARPKGGRYANTYRLAMPDMVSPEKSVKSANDISPENSGKTEVPEQVVSPENSGMVSPEKSGTIPLEETQEGAGALGARPALFYSDDVLYVNEVIETQDQKGEKDVGARERAPATPAVNHPETAADPEEVTAGDPYADAMAELDALHGDEIGDVEGYLLDLIDGFNDGDRAAAQRAARRTAKLLLDAGSGALAIWSTHCRIVYAISLAANGKGRADAAVSDFHSAVAVAGEVLKSERRAKFLKDDANEEEGYGF